MFPICIQRRILSEERYLAVVLSKVVNSSSPFQHKSLSLLGFHSGSVNILDTLLTFRSGLITTTDFFFFILVFSKDIDIQGFGCLGKNYEENCC